MLTLYSYPELFGVADNNGYFSSNTMSGTRMNSKIEDLGQSITVMTKEQMTSFKALMDIRDGHEWDPFEGLEDRKSVV